MPHLANRLRLVPAECRTLVRAIVCLVAAMFVSFPDYQGNPALPQELYAVEAPDFVPCPPTEVTPPPVSPPPYCFPLQTFGRWSAVPQCYNLWPAEGSGNECRNAAGDLDSTLNMFPRGLYSVHAALTYEGKVALWKQTYNLSLARTIHDGRASVRFDGIHAARRSVFCTAG